jgi:hypothetical protein
VSTVQYTVPKGSENFVTHNYGAGCLFSVTKAFVIDVRRPAAVKLSVTKFTNLLGQCIEVILNIGIQ